MQTTPTPSIPLLPRSSDELMDMSRDELMTYVRYVERSMRVAKSMAAPSTPKEQLAAALLQLLEKFDAAMVGKPLLVGLHGPATTVNGIEQLGRTVLTLESNGYTVEHVIPTNDGIVFYIRMHPDEDDDDVGMTIPQSLIQDAALLMVKVGGQPGEFGDDPVQVRCEKAVAKITANFSVARMRSTLHAMHAIVLLHGYACSAESHGETCTEGEMLYTLVNLLEQRIADNVM